jgi:hypothetical protein
MATYFSCVFIHNGEPGYFGQSLVHDPKRAKELFERLEYPFFGFQHHGSDAYTGFLAAPRKGYVHIGAYPEGYLWLDTELLQDAWLKPGFVAERLTTLFPGQHVTALFHEATGMSWLYIVIELGVVKRVHSGNWANVVYEFGEPLPLENRYWSGGTRADPEDGENLLYVGADGIEQHFWNVHIGTAFDLYNALLGCGKVSALPFPLEVETFKQRDAS